MDSYDEKIEGTTKGLLKFGFKSLAIAGETVKPFLPLFGEALSIVDEIVNIYEDAQYNRKSCITLIDRVENAKTAVKSLSRRKEENEEKFREEGYYLSFTKFVGILKRIKSFVKEVSSLSKFRNVIQASEIREKFKILIEDFDSNVSILKLAMIISNEEQRKKDNEILEGDLAGMTKYLENVEGGLTNVKTGINTVLEEVEILNKKIDKLTSSSIVGKEFIPTEILPIELEEPKQKFTNDNYYKKWSRKLLNDVFCKKIITANEDTLEYKKINAQLAILGRMQESTSIIKFYGLSTVNSEKVMVFEWAEYGNLKEFYEKYEIDWPLKLQIAVNICRGIAFLHGWCESILITDNIEPKISNFVYSRYDNQQTSNISKVKTNYNLNWMAPEKIEQHTHNQKVTIEGKKIYKKYTVRCDIFSFGMLLWELAFQRMPYKNYNQQQIMEYVTAGGREKFDFGLNLTSVQQEFGNVIKAAADNGLDIARFNLGNLYINGKLGFDKDNDTGLRYLRLAAYNRHPDAMAMLNTLKN
ncbi:kinase-like protein [Rhizophagus irregularis]|uniref:Kinase-like protein n=1 Tax=Rhizophagus irregularis TaxID=588596 RepID=A0A2I1GCK0_9GLOM|nr:kinase-like protein [Rhizophagus irregularis]